MSETGSTIFLYVLAFIVCGATGLLILWSTGTFEKRFAVRWWPHKPNWLWGVRNNLHCYRPGYFAIHLGPLELVYRTKERAQHLIDDGPTRYISRPDPRD